MLKNVVCFNFVNNLRFGALEISINLSASNLKPVGTNI